MKEVEKHSLIEISGASARTVRNALSIMDEDILTEFENIERAFKARKPKSVGFILSHKGVEQHDCGLYAMSIKGDMEKEKKLHVFGTIRDDKPDCRESMRRIARGVAAVANTSSTGSRYGFNRVLWFNHPNPRVAAATGKAPVNDLWLFDVIHGVPAGQKTFVQYPITIIEVQKGDSLSKIAKDKTGSEANWKAIWALNADDIPNPNQVRKGMKIVVPATIRGWKPVDMSKYASAADVAVAQYGTGQLTGLVEFVCESETVAELSEEDRCDIPVFLRIDDYKMVLMKPT